MKPTSVRPAALCSGLLLGAAITAQASAQTQQLTRTSAFEYNLSTGLLIREVIEPGNSDLCLATTYAYDAYGNRSSATARNCNGSPFNDGLNPSEYPAPTCPFSSACIAPRTIATGFDGTTVNGFPGQFPTSSTNARNHRELREFDSRFGTITKLTGPNQLATTWTYDEFGRKLSESRADGTSTNWFYERCVDLSAGSCPSPLPGQTASPAQYRVRVTASGAPETNTYYDSLNRAIRTETQGFDGNPIRKDTRYDTLGRIAKVSQPFVGEGTQIWTTFSYDILGRITVLDEPTVNSATKRTRTEYDGLVSSVTISNADSGTNMPGNTTQTTTTTKNSQGQVISVFRW